MGNLVLEYLGHPLLTGDELMATSDEDLFVRWKPSSHAYFMRLAHPFHGQEPESTARSVFGGYPPVTAPDGTVIADDKTNRFMALIDGFRSSRWHRDTGSSLGIPMADFSVIFSGIGGPGATHGVTAIDSATGVSRWTFAPEGLPQDPQVARKVLMRRYVSKIVPRGGGQIDTSTPEGVRAFLKQAIERGFEERLDSELIATVQPYSQQPHGHWTNSGLVLAGGRVYAEVNGTIATLDSRTGSPGWRKPLPEGQWVRSMVATDKHLVMCLSTGPRRPLWNHTVIAGEKHFLAAWQLDDGKEVWKESVERPGSLALSDGLVYFANGDLRVLGPAERTYRLAADTNASGEYHRPAGELGNPVALDCSSPTDLPAQQSEPAEPQPDTRGDASVLRLTTDEAPAVLLQKARERRKAAYGVSLLVQVDWLDAKRENVRGSGPKLSRERVESLLSLCARIAEEARPDYFDLAPEINIYLRRYPDQLLAVLDLIARAGSTVRQIVPGCKVLFSLNAETALDIYGRGTHRPFGDLPRLTPEAVRALDALIASQDTLGITSHPQAAFRTAEQIPPDHLLRLRTALRRRTLLVTRLAIQVDQSDPPFRAIQAGFGERLLETCYWLNARLVVLPEWIGYTPRLAADGKTPTDLVRHAQERWRGAVRWEHRDELTAVPPPAVTGADAVAGVPHLN